MITAAPITQRAAEDEVNARTVERDYVLAHIIAGFAALGNDSPMSASRRKADLHK